MWQTTEATAACDQRSSVIGTEQADKPSATLMEFRLTFQRLGKAATASLDQGLASLRLMPVADGKQGGIPAPAELRAGLGFGFDHSASCLRRTVQAAPEPPDQINERRGACSRTAPTWEAALTALTVSVSCCLCL